MKTKPESLRYVNLENTASSLPAPAVQGQAVTMLITSIQYLPTVRLCIVTLLT